ncbi:TetR/AcrR family transcriptional regulator, partial [bacterium]
MKKKSSNAENKLIWERDEPVVTPPPVPLSRESIVRVAIEIADKEGLSSVSFRKIGAFMGAGHMRLYTYFDTKEELLELMLDTFFAEIVANEIPSSDWKEGIRAISNNTRKAALNHPWIIDILGNRPHISPNALVYIEKRLTILYQASESKEMKSIFLASMALKAYIMGFIRDEISELRAEAEGKLNNKSFHETTESYMKFMIESGRFPMIDKVMNNGASSSLENEFIEGLECIL